MTEKRYTQEVKVNHIKGRLYKVTASRYLIKTNKKGKVIKKELINEMTLNFFEPLICKSFKNYYHRIESIAEQFQISDYEVADKRRIYSELCAEKTRKKLQSVYSTC